MKISRGNTMKTLSNIKRATRERILQYEFKCVMLEYNHLGIEIYNEFKGIDQREEIEMITKIDNEILLTAESEKAILLSDIEDIHELLSIEYILSVSCS